MNVKKKKKWQLSLPVKLIIIILLCSIFGKYMNTDIKRFGYTLSLTIKSVLTFILPLIIFSFLFSCMITLKRGAITFIVMLLVTLSVSNMVSTMMAFGISRESLSFFSNLSFSNVSADEGLRPFWNMQLPKWIPNEYALLGGFIIGSICSFFQWEGAIKVSMMLKSISQFLLEKCLVPIVPIFILGFVLQFQHQKILGQIFEYYGGILCIILLSQLIYVVFLYGVGSGFNVKKWVASIKNVLPAGVAGFSSMSSMVALPLTLRAAEQNSTDSELARAVIPTTVNIHLIGDCLWIPTMALGILHAYGYDQPGIAAYALFGIFFVLAKFSVAAVPGGGIIVMLPILEKYFGFSPEMSSLILALYVLFDAFITMINVLGNGAFAVLFIKMYKFAINLFIKKEKVNTLL